MIHKRGVLACQLPDGVCDEVPEFLVDAFGPDPIGSLLVAVVMEGPHGHVVDVDPNGTAPVGGVVLCVVL